MKNSTREAPGLLGLDVAEEKILTLLGQAEESLTAATLARTAKLPRSTVVDTIKKLHERGWLRKVHVGKHSEWRLMKASTLKEKFFEFVTSIEKKVAEPTSVLNVQTSPKTGVAVYSGVPQIISLYKTILKTHAGERLYAVQSPQSIEQWFENVPIEEIIEINELIKKQRLIVDGIGAASALSISQHQPDAWKKSMEGRSTSIAIVPEELLSFEAELYIFEDLALITNWSEKICMTIKNNQIIALFKSMYFALNEVGKRFDTNEFLRKQLL